MILIYAIDSTFVDQGAFRFFIETESISGLPLLYWLAYFPGGILFGYYIPREKWWRLFYILLAAFVLLILELLAVYFGYFYYLNWNPFKSYILNIVGFTTMLWFAEWIGVLGKEPVKSIKGY
ncbi:MAG: hypothetical protein ACOY46_17280 [Bacillota bacterium]